MWLALLDVAVRRPQTQRFPKWLYDTVYDTLSESKQLRVLLYDINMIYLLSQHNNVATVYFSVAVPKLFASKVGQSSFNIASCIMHYC